MNCYSCGEKSLDGAIYCAFCGQDLRNCEKPLEMRSPSTRVYVVQNQEKDGASKFDLAPANQFGTLVFCLSPNAKPFNAANCIKELHLKLRSIRRHDYLLLLGNPCLIGWATAIAAHYSGGSLNLLQWEKREKAYIVIPCDIQIWS